MSLLATNSEEFSVNAWGAKFTVYGTAKPGGSKRIGRVGGSGRPIILDDNRQTKDWKEQIQLVAATLMRGRDPFKGALYLRVTFYRPRPQSHFNKSGLKRGMPTHPITKPDTTKLLRPLEDALSGIIYEDDRQIVEQIVRKCYGEPERVDVVVGVMV